jgi:peptide deformylase
MSMKIVIHPDERLRQVSSDVDDFALMPRLARQMLAFMQLNRGVGLAGPQIGDNRRIFVMSPSGFAAGGRVIINPMVLEASTERSIQEEGCLSIPDVRIAVNRPTSIRARFVDITGDEVEEDFNGFDARVFLHEMDHLDVKLIIDYYSGVDGSFIKDDEWLDNQLKSV